MDPSVKLEKLRDVAMDDVVKILGHRVPGSDYTTIHPPLDEGSEPDCPIRAVGRRHRGCEEGRQDQVRSVH